MKLISKSVVIVISHKVKEIFSLTEFFREKSWLVARHRRLDDQTFPKQKQFFRTENYSPIKLVSVSNGEKIQIKTETAHHCGYHGITIIINPNNMIAK